MGEYRGSGIGVSKGHSRIGPAPSPLQPRQGGVGSGQPRDDSGRFRRSDQSIGQATPPVGVAPGPLPLSKVPPKDW
jgi:hypothetical protein